MEKVELRKEKKYSRNFLDRWMMNERGCNMQQWRERERETTRRASAAVLVARANRLD